MSHDQREGELQNRQVIVNYGPQIYCTLKRRQLLRKTGLQILKHYRKIYYFQKQINNCKIIITISFGSFS